MTGAFKNEIQKIGNVVEFVDIVFKLVLIVIRVIALFTSHNFVIFYLRHMLSHLS